MPSKVILVAGARPNFMKIASLWTEMNRLPADFEPMILRTGQHHDYEMSTAGRVADVLKMVRF